MGRAPRPVAGPKTSTSGPGAPLSERPNCLVVDGHPLVRIGLRGVLEDGFEVHESETREDALDLVRDIGDFDVAVVDIGWRLNGIGPSIAGTEAIRAMHQATPGMGIVAHGE